MTGQRFGKLIVKSKVPHQTETGKKVTYWLCECDCGKSCEVSSASLRNGSKLSCGCEPRHFKGEDLVGNTYGDIQVIGIDENKRNNKKYGYWICKCSCGNQFSERGDHLKDNMVLCCQECKNRINDITGMKFGKLTVIKKKGLSLQCLTVHL